MKFVHNHGGKAIFITHSMRKDTTEEENKKIFEKLNQEGSK